MPEQKDNDDLAIRFSSDLIGALKGMVRVHNKKSPNNKVNFNSLKKVYINAASDYDYAGYSRGHWALARVNMFLRVANGEMPQAVERTENNNIGGLIFETKIIAEEEHDISMNWVPSQKDFTEAKKQIENNNLLYDFASVKDLYLEDYQPIELKVY
tara:strand:- start:6200 stop:6667 length:468 start_codon:yes stop_codon:yes gene_type:complete